MSRRVDRSGTSPRVLVTGVLSIALLVATACSAEQVMDAPGCDGGSTLVVAQSVPTAGLVPCFEPLPNGWSFTTVTVNQDGTTVHLDSDRAGDDAATLRYSDSCELGAAVRVPSDFEGAERFDEIEQLQPSFRARVHYRFEGGCITWTFDFDSDASATESIALEDSLAVVGRDELNDMLRVSFIDEEL